MSLRPNTKIDARRHGFKNLINADEGRRRREQDLVQIRRKRREQSLNKKRRIGVDARGVGNLLIILQAAVAGVYSDDVNEQLQAITGLRKLVSSDNPPIREVLQSGVVSRVVQLLGNNDSPTLQHEAAWVLTNIASGESEGAIAVIGHGAVPMFVRLLGSPHVTVRHQVVWALGNIAGTSRECRDVVLSNEALGALLTQFTNDVELSMVKTATWALSNFCKHKPKPSFELTKAGLPVLQQLVKFNDDEVQSEACWALSHLSDEIDESDGSSLAVIEAGFCPRLLKLLPHQSNDVVLPALLTVGNLIMINDHANTQSMIDFGALPPLVELLSNPRTDTITREACSVIMTIAAGTKELLEAVIQAGIVDPLVNLLEQAELDIRKEAAWAISNATRIASNEQIRYESFLNPMLTSSSCRFLVHAGCIRPICSLLGCDDPFAIYSCLVALENILRAGEEEKKGINVYAQMVSLAGGAEKVWNLQGNNDHDDIDEVAVEILELYFEELMGAQQQARPNEVLVEVEEGLAEAHRVPEFELIGCFRCLECATSSLVLELKCRYLSVDVHIRDEKYYVQSWSL
ncbi:hypothetical protein Droror1_Dr00003697 [Drosera rotundifolia]